MEWFEQFLTWLEKFGETPNQPLVLLILFFSAGIEYVFPPFPGDTVTLVGALFVGKWHWSFTLVFVAVTLGSTAGAAVDYLFGRKLYAWRESRDSGADRGIRRVLEGFRRWGIWLIAANRFFPGIRAFFFVAAGMAGFSFWPVMALALVSALAWNVLIVGLGLYIGAEFDRLREVVGKYQTAVWILIGAAVIVIIVVYLKRRRTRA